MAFWENGRMGECLPYLDGAIEAVVKGRTRRDRSHFSHLSHLSRVVPSLIPIFVPSICSSFRLILETFRCEVGPVVSAPLGSMRCTPFGQLRLAAPRIASEMTIACSIIACNRNSDQYKKQYPPIVVRNIFDGVNVPVLGMATVSYLAQSPSQHVLCLSSFQILFLHLSSSISSQCRSFMH